MPAAQMHHLDELARQTNRYSISEIGPGRFEIFDARGLLDELLRFPELRPAKGDSTEADFDALLAQAGSGPTMNVADRKMLGWLTGSVEELDENEENVAYLTAFARPIVELCAAFVSPRPHYRS